MQGYTKKEIERIGRALRKAEQVSALARSIGVSRTTVSAVLNGREVSARIVREAAAYLDRLQGSAPPVGASGSAPAA